MKITISVDCGDYGQTKVISASKEEILQAVSEILDDDVARIAIEKRTGTKVPE